jgi:hypothetical protein
MMNLDRTAGSYTALQGKLAIEALRWAIYECGAIETRIALYDDRLHLFLQIANQEWERSLCGERSRVAQEVDAILDDIDCPSCKRAAFAIYSHCDELEEAS